MCYFPTPSLNSDTYPEAATPKSLCPKPRGSRKSSMMSSCNSHHGKPSKPKPQRNNAQIPNPQAISANPKPPNIQTSKPFKAPNQSL